jgi:hypothetical protein
MSITISWYFGSAVHNERNMDKGEKTPNQLGVKRKRD